MDFLLVPMLIPLRLSCRQSNRVPVLSTVKLWRLSVCTTMLQLLPAGPIPADTLRVAKAALPEENKYVKLRNFLGPIFDDALFAPLFPERGQTRRYPVETGARYDSAVC